MFQISRSNLIKLYTPASTGKLLNGLIHNINGFLQNIGMDMDMMSYSLTGTDKTEPDLVEGLKNRLSRMNEEFDNLNRLLQNASMRANLDQGSHGHLGLDEFIDQILSSLRANLYFKHHVQTQCRIENWLPVMGDFPVHFGTALSWFLEALAEDLERQDIQNLSIEAETDAREIRMILTFENGRLSDTFLSSFENTKEDDRILDPDHVGTVVAAHLFETCGVSVSNCVKKGGTEIVLTAPLP